MIYTNITDLIGKTPLLELTRIENKDKLKAKVIAKLEAFNPGGSVKDRAALSMLNEAEKSGHLKPGFTIIEPTSGNTGIGLASIAAARGYNIIIVMPDTMTDERKKLIKAYGAKLVLTPGEDGMKGAIAKAEELANEITDSYIPSQFKNSSNPLAHQNSTGPEIWEDTEGLIDIFVAGVGTGGTITGVGDYLKSKNNGIEVFAVEPKDSPVLSGGDPGEHKIAGIGPSFIPEILDTQVYDAIIQIENDEAFEATRELAAIEGFLVGASSGAALAAAKKLAMMDKNEGKTIVVLFPDTGERYLSTTLFDYPVES